MNEQEIFASALDRERDERDAYLVQVCGADIELRQRVEALLHFHDAGGGYMDKPAPEIVATQECPAVAEKPGTQIGPYKLREQIGEGGFGVVYVAEQEKPVTRKVALKIIKPGMDTKEVIGRFEAERQALALMDHPNVAKVLDAGETESGRPYFVMELVKGVPITEFCDDQQLSTRERIALFVDVCRAVQHAHQKGVIHRDLKPSNIMVTMRDAKPVAKVIDFGVSKALSRKLTDKTVYTAYGQMIGTPLYMSPEQAQLNEIDVDTRSDVYSLGVLLYELLTGTTPFDRETLTKAGFDELRRIIREDEPPRPSARVSTLNAEALSTVSGKRKVDPRRLSQSLRGELDWIVMKALEKDRNRRYESASAFAADVERYLADEPVHACPPSLAYRFRKFVRRKKGTLATVTVLGLGLLIAVGSIAGSLGWMAHERKARQTRRAAQIDLILDDVDRLMKEQNWPAALAAAERAEAAVQISDARETTQQAVRVILKDVRFIERLERIRMQRVMIVDGQWNLDYAGVDRKYAEAFREYGVDVDRLPTETAVARFKVPPAFALAVAATLDDWVEARRMNPSADAAAWKRLVAVARGIDSDSLRDRLRASWGEAVTPESQARLRRLAESLDIRRQQPANLVALTNTLARSRQWELSNRMLRQAQSIHPGDFWINYLLGVQLQESEDHAGAIRFFAAAASIRPHVAPAHNNLGTALYHEKRLDEAIACYRKAIEVDPKLAMAHNNLGVALSDQNKLSEAIGCYRTAIRLDPKFPFPHNNLGIAMHEQAKLDESIACYKTAIQLNPEYAEAHHNLGNALSDLGKGGESIASYRRAIELDPEHAEHHYGLGNALMKQGQPAEAEASFRKAVELDPDYFLAHTNLGNVLRDQGKIHEAAAAFRTAVELDPNHALARTNLGIALCEQGKSEDGFDCFRKAIELDPKCTLAYISFGNELMRRGDLDEAISLYQQAIKVDPKRAAYYIGLGVCLLQQRQSEAAEAAFRKAIAIEPKNARAHTNLGVALRNQGKLDQALEASRKATELAPEASQVHFGLGIVLLQKRELAKSIDAFRTAIRLNRDNADAHMYLGNAFWMQQQWQAAATAYRNAVRLRPDWGEAHHSLGFTLAVQEKVDEAIAAYKEAIRHNSAFARQRAGQISGSHCLLLAIAASQLGEKQHSLWFYDRAARWMDQDPKRKKNPVYRRLRGKAERMLGIPAVARRPRRR